MPEIRSNIKRSYYIYLFYYCFIFIIIIFRKHIQIADILMNDKRDASLSCLSIKRRFVQYSYAIFNFSIYSVKSVSRNANKNFLPRRRPRPSVLSARLFNR